MTLRWRRSGCGARCSSNRGSLALILSLSLTLTLTLTLTPTLTSHLSP